MNKNQKLFLKLISSALNGEKRAISPDECDYEALQSIAVHNSCLSLLYQGAVNCSLSVPSCWKHASSYSVIDSYRKLQVESEVIDILKQNGIRSCVLKGSSVALNYPNPLIRTMGDIDLLVDEANYQKAILLFASQKVIDNNRHDFHVGFDYKNIRIEIHKKITESKAPVCEFLQDAMEHIELKSCDGFCVPVLSVEYQAISLLEHMLRHFRDNQFVFRMYCDWVCFVSGISDECWQNDVYPIVNRIGLSLFSDALNKSAMLYLGFDMKRKIFTNIEDETCAIMIEEFLSVDKNASANGIDVNLGTLLSTRYSDNNILTAYFASVNSIARRKYALGKYKIFQPFFWIWLPVKYMFNIFIGRRKKLDFKKISNTVMRRKILLDNLKM